MQFTHLIRKRKLPSVNSSDILPLAFAGLSVGVLVLAVAFFWLAFSLTKVANQNPPTLVQQVDGKAFTVRPADYLHREPEVIRRMVSDWATMTFTWGSLPDNTEKNTDEGMKVAEGKRVPTTAWAASFLIAPDFRDQFLQQLSNDVVPEGVFSGEISAVLIPQQISPPQVLEEGVWQVDLMATRILFDETNPAGTSIPFNRRLYVRAVEPPRTPLDAQASPQQQVIYQSLESGLQIEEIRPIHTED
ncbi:MAG: hypothetical protein AAFY33_07045 [Cyanobacteria bacterium J06643_4]